jgi:ABC-2 type transport system permease protein
MFRMRLIAGMQYRAAAWAGVATQFFWGFMQIMIFLAFYRSSSAPPPMTVTEMSSYIWLQQAFLAIIMLWSQDNELLKQIADGNIAYELCRPYDLFSFWYARLIAQRLSNAALRCLPILIVAALLPAPYNMTLPAGGAAGGLFVLAMAFAVLLVVAISMFIYILTFVTLSPVGARLIVGVTAEFFMGAIIPIPMMPGKLQKVLNFLPFRYTSDLPFRIYSGNIAGADALRQIGIQVIWTACLLALGAWAFRRVTRRIVVQGG